MTKENRTTYSPNDGELQQQPTHNMPRDRPHAETLDTVYQAKAELLNSAFQEMGFGKYQWHLFFLAGFGWLADNVWQVSSYLILPPVAQEFSARGPLLYLALYVGLAVGTFVWGLGSDVWGRKISFNTTLAVAGVFGMVAAASPTFASLAVFVTIWGLGCGGNLPVDSSIFLEFIPGTHEYLLTVLAMWWSIGQVLTCLIAWPFIANYSCDPAAATCDRKDNMGWRYHLITMGAIMLVLWVLRFFIFPMYETPKYLMGRGRFTEAVEVVHAVAKYNGKTLNLTVEQLQNAGIEPNNLDKKSRDVESAGPPPLDTSGRAVIKRRFKHFNVRHVSALFETKTMALSTSVIIAVWALIGLAWPLYSTFIPYYFATRGADFGDGSVYITYRNQVIIATIGMVGAVVGGLVVEVPFLGRRGTLAISTIITGVFLFASTTARSSNTLLGWNCGYGFTSNIMYGTLYGMTPELFPTKDRGTGNGIAATVNRIFGIMSPIIALYADLTTSVPIYVSGSLFIVAGLLGFLLPFEPRGRASL
ncbi:hypothetical protein FRC12_001654 [Ceratobasidium sp. 428]|nr:hypothetical protein FRC12_001654 [Ceratobasidium sp. 428]